MARSIRFANYASLQRQDDRTLAWSPSRSNTTAADAAARQRQGPGLGEDEIRRSTLLPAARAVFAAFLPRFYENHEIIAASAHVTISDTASNSSYETTLPVRLRSAEDMFWGNGFKNASFIASWVTPHDRQVEAVLSRAKKLIPDRRLPGYESWKSVAQQEQETYREARAI
jgi:hypothetical protein